MYNPPKIFGHITPAFSRMRKGELVFGNKNLDFYKRVTEDKNLDFYRGCRCNKNLDFYNLHPANKNLDFCGVHPLKNFFKNF